MNPSLSDKNFDDHSQIVCEIKSKIENSISQKVSQFVKFFQSKFWQELISHGKVGRDIGYDIAKRIVGTDEVVFFDDSGKPTHDSKSISYVLPLNVLQAVHDIEKRKSKNPALVHERYLIMYTGSVVLVDLYGEDFLNAEKYIKTSVESLGLNSEQENLLTLILMAEFANTATYVGSWVRGYVLEGIIEDLYIFEENSSEIEENSSEIEEAVENDAEDLRISVVEVTEQEIYENSMQRQSRKEKLQSES